MTSANASASSLDDKPRSNAGLSLAEIVQRNDRIRMTLTGAQVLFTPELMEWPPEFRGRLLYRLTLYQKFSDDSDHSEGVFTFAGHSIIWRISDFAGELSLTLSTRGEDMVP